jgi:ubiquinone/menaquinone biosynthesis C-methylase UbiE
MEASVDQLKERARATWAAGNFDVVAQFILSVGEKLVEVADIEPRMRVLDVACGTGNATIPAAKAGAVTTGLDLVPELLAHAKRHAYESGVEIEWVEGDAEALPFADGSFDRVLSTFGVMFAPRHDVTAAELARVCSPGGTIAVANWTPEGMNGDMFKIVGSRMPPPPPIAQPPLLWGTEDHVRQLFEPHGLEVSFERAMAVFRGESVPWMVERMETNFGPWQMAQAALGDGWAEVRAELVELYERTARPGEDGSVEAFAEYLIAVAKKPA